MKKLHFKGVITVFAGLLTLSSLVAFENGPLLHFRADFGGALTTPFISDESLKAFNKGAEKMTGMMSNLLMSGEVEAGYVFSSDRFFGLSKNNLFSGVGAFACLGVGQGNTAQKITARTPTGTIDTFVSVNFMPVINFGVTGKAYFFSNRLALGLGIGGRMIADTRPQYFAYSTEPSVLDTIVGEITVTEEMMKKMNPLMASVKGIIEYNIPFLPTVDMVLGWFTRYNIYRPNYITAPPKLVQLAAANGGDLTKPFPDYWLNSLDFGVTVGFAFKL